MTIVIRPGIPPLDRPLDYALTYLQCGISVIPIGRDGEKKPITKWKRLQEKPMTRDEAFYHWDVNDPPGIAAVCGAVSGNLALIDFDNEANFNFPQFVEFIELERPGLLKKLPLVKSPREPVGWHLWVRVDAPVGSQADLAIDPLKKEKEGLLIERRGEGFYGMLPGSPACCHKMNREYKHEAGPQIWEMESITEEEYLAIIRCTQLLDRRTPELEKKVEQLGRRVGDCYDLEGPEWPAILEPLGWRIVRRAGPVLYWCRPGKDGKEWSATTGMCRGKNGEDLLRVFTSSAHPLVAGKAYGKFRVHAIIHHNSDFAAAAKELAELGYGEGMQTFRVVGGNDDQADDDEGKPGKPSKGEQIAEFEAEFRLFHTPDRQPFARVPRSGPEGDYHACVNCKSDELALWITNNIYQASGEPPSSTKVNEMLNALLARALFGSPREKAYIRFAPEPSGGVIIDLAQENGKCVVVNAEGVRILKTAPVNFCRPAGMLPLPDPKFGGNPQALWQILNFAEADRVLVGAWIMQAMRQEGAYPILMINGRHGSGKTTTGRYTRELIDPTEGGATGAPKNEEDLFIQGANSPILLFDNLDGFSGDMASALCRISTGAALSKRAKYTDSDEKKIYVCRPMIFTAIGDITRREDLQSRLIPVECPKLDKRNRKTLKKHDAVFKEAHPWLFGIILEAFSKALRKLPEIPEVFETRLPDFEAFGQAAEEGLGFPAGSFLAALLMKKADLEENAIQSDHVALALMEVNRRTPNFEFEGSMADLLQLLNEKYMPVKKPPHWPLTPSHLSNRLRRLLEVLETAGLEVSFDRTPGGNRQRAVMIRRGDRQEKGATAPPDSSSSLF
jgi:hypothetical protein